MSKVPCHYCGVEILKDTARSVSENIVFSNSQ